MIVSARDSRGWPPRIVASEFIHFSPNLTRWLFQSNSTELNFFRKSLPRIIVGSWLSRTKNECCNLHPFPISTAISAFPKVGTGDGPTPYTLLGLLTYSEPIVWRDSKSMIDGLAPESTKANLLCPFSVICLISNFDSALSET